MGKIISKISKKWQLVIYITLMSGACVFFVSTLIAPKYQTQTTLLIFQKDVDIASAAQSAEFLSEVFVQVAFSEPFIDSVLDSPYNIEKSFSFEPVKKKKQWKKDVIVESIGKAGVLKITVFDESRLESRKIAQAIARSFAENSSEYYGGRGTIELKPIDGPTTSDSPVSPNIFLNTVWGLFAGFVFSILLSIFFESFNFKLIGKSSLAGEIVGDQLRRQLAKRQERKELMYEHETEEAESAQAEEFMEKEDEDEPIYEEDEVESPSPFAEEESEQEFAVEQAVSQKDLSIETFKDGQDSQVEEAMYDAEGIIENKNENVEVEKETLQAPTTPKTEISQEPDFAGSMISEDEFRSGVLAKEESVSRFNEHSQVDEKEDKQLEEKEEDIFSSELSLARREEKKKKEEVVSDKREEQKEVVETGKKVLKKGGFLSRLYGRSLFADKKISKIEEKRAVHEREFPDFENDDYFPQIERAKDFTLQGIQKVETKIEEAKSEGVKKIVSDEIKKENIFSNKGTTAPAPENLPVFMNEEEAQEKDDFMPKEFSPIEHVDSLEENLLQENPVEEKKPEEQSKKSFEEMVLSGELKDSTSDDQSGNQIEMQRVEEAELERKSNPDKEPTEEEVKERLNRLLKGEL